MDRKNENDRVSLIKFFFLMFKLSAFTFGGGWVIISMMQKEFVEKRGWITSEEMQDITVVAQSSPGPVAINCAMMLGYKLRGAGGLAAAAAGVACPPLIILTVISIFYTEFREAEVIAAVLLGMRAGVAAVVLDVALSMCSGIIKNKKWVQIAVMTGAFIAVCVFGINAIIVVLLCLAAGIIKTVAEVKK